MIDEKRILQDIETLAGFNSTPGEGVTRFSYSEEDRLARDYLISRMEEAGLAVRTDPIGTIFGRLEGSHGRVEPDGQVEPEDLKDADPALSPILTGSHIDTVLHGGKYDGVVGTVCALEALRSIREDSAESGKVAGVNAPTLRPLEMIVFPEEEGANFGSPLAGSKALTGIYTAGDLKKFINDRGVSMYDAAKSFGLDPDAMPSHILRPGDVHAMIEVHVEQSIVLDRKSLPVGIVTGIAGMRWIKVTLDGEPNHAGATPMTYRHDPMPGAAELALAVEQAAVEAGPTTVGSSAKITCTPNVPNVIPQRVELYLDIRDVNRSGMDHVIARVREKLYEIETRRGLGCTMEITGSVEPTACAPGIIDALKKSAGRSGIPFIEMTSGALHDTAIMAGVSDIGMLFVPSINGRSHVPEENTAIEDIRKGCTVLEGALLELAAR